MQTYNKPTGIVYQGMSLYTNNVLKNGDFAWLVGPNTRKITRGCLFRPTETMGNAAHAMYFIPDKSSQMPRYEPDFERAVKVDNLLLAATYDDAKAYLDGIAAAHANVTGDASEFPDNMPIWIVDHAREEPIPCVLASMNIGGSVRRYAVPIVSYDTNGTVILDYDRMLSAYGHQFSRDYLDAKRLSVGPRMGSTQRPSTRWSKDLAAAERLVRDVNAGADGNVVKMPATTAARHIQEEPIPCVLASMNIGGSVRRYAVPIVSYDTNGTVILDYDRMLSAYGHQFSRDYLDAKRLSVGPRMGSTQRPSTRWSKDLAAAERLVRDVNAGADGNVVKMPATTAARHIQAYMDAVYKTNESNIKIRVVLTNVGEWYCVMSGPFSSDNVRVIHAVYQDNSLDMRRGVLDKGIMCRRLCEKLLRQATGMNIRTSVVIPGIPEINLVCD